MLKMHFESHPWSQIVGEPEEIPTDHGPFDSSGISSMT